MKKKLVQRLAAAAVSLLTAFSLAACGNAGTDNTVQKEWVYVPEFVTLEDENTSYYDMKLAGNYAYYSSWTWDEASGKGENKFFRYSLTDRKAEEVPLIWPEESSVNINEYTIGSDGSIYAITYESIPMPDTQDGYDSRQILYKFDPQGNQVFSVNLTEKMKEDPENSYIRAVAADGQGRLYVCSESMVWLYDAEGKDQGKLSLTEISNGWINGLGCGRDGKVYVNYYANDGASGTTGYNVAELDFEGKKVGTVYTNFPNTNSSSNTSFGPGIEKDFLLYDNTGVYEYDLASQTKEQVIEWLDSDINGSSVSAFGVLEDGRFAAVYRDWESNDSGIALLTKTKSSETVQKQTILIGTLYENSEIQAAAVKFNKSSDKYHISIRSYMGDVYDDFSTALTDALANMNNDLTSKNGPDIIDLAGLNLTQLAAKGVFEDLNPWLEKSSVLDRAGLVENVLKAYTYDDVLVSIPSTFSIHTVIGNKADFEGKQGWTIDEMIAYADAHPGAELFDRTAKSEIMQYLMMYNESAFVDWSTGECKFDSDEFKGLLKFVNRFPDDIDYNGDMVSTPNRIQRGEVLLDTVGVSDFDSVQVPIEEFKGQGAFIGFPTVDGASGHALMANQAYAIASKSKNKEGAWTFIESYLTREDNGRYWYGFPTVKAKLDAMIADATKVETYQDEAGETIIIGGGGSMTYGDGWSFEYHTTTQEEVDMVMALIEAARPISYNYGSEIINIINTEAEGYYKGQKSVDEVANIIQSRVKIYVEENR